VSTIQVRNIGTYGFDVTALSGVNLSSAEADATRSRVNDALALADAIREAFARARSAGAASFEPSDGSLLVLPAGLSADSRDALFDDVIGHAFSGGPLDLPGWSQAVDALDRWAATQASMLPVEAGGGSRVIQGTWYVNGLPWSLSELFTVNRVNTLSEIDRLVADSLNVIAANNEAAKALTSLMKNLFGQYYQMGDGSFGTTPMVTAAGQVDSQHPISYGQLLAYAQKYIGPTSLIQRISEDTSDATAEAFNNQLFYHENEYVTSVNATGAAQMYRAKGPIDSTNGELQGFGDVRNKKGTPEGQYLFPEWESGHNYANKDIVLYNKKVYQRDGDVGNDDFTQGIPGDWHEVSEWNAATEYREHFSGDHNGDCVLYMGDYYQLASFSSLDGTDNTSGYAPTTDYWQKIGEWAIPRGSTPKDNPNFWEAVDAQGGLIRADYRSMIDEVETILNNFSADNQVAQLRNETLFNSRSNLLEGLSAFLKGQQSVRAEVARNP
jgi:hypothetical protein